MIDYFSLALGHGLLAIALLRLVMRDDVDVDPAIETLKEDSASQPKATSLAQRNAKRREQAARSAAHPGEKSVD